MGVANEADVAHADGATSELVLDHVLMKLQAAHAKRLHDLIGTVAGIDDNRVGASDDEETQRQHAARASTIPAENKKTRFQLDVPVIENLDFQRHVCLPVSLLALAGAKSARARADRSALPCRARSHRDDAGWISWRRDRPGRDCDSWSTASRSENSNRT